MCFDSHEAAAARFENELPVDALRELLVHACVLTRRAWRVGIKGLEFLTVVAEGKRVFSSGTLKKLGSEEDVLERNGVLSILLGERSWGRRGVGGEGEGKSEKGRERLHCFRLNVTKGCVC